MFKKNRWNLHSRNAEKGITLSKVFKSLNYVPLPYEPTEIGIEYYNTAPKEFQRRINATKIDDLNYDMCDPEIDSHINWEIAEKKKQFTYHIAAIYQNIGLIEGAFETARLHLGNLEKELQLREEEEKNLRNLIKDVKI